MAIFELKKKIYISFLFQHSKQGILIDRMFTLRAMFELVRILLNFEKENKYYLRI